MSFFSAISAARFSPSMQLWCWAATRHSRHDVARHDDDSAAFELIHGRKGMAEVGEEGFPRFRVSHAMRKPGRYVERDPEFTPLAVGPAKVLLRPVLVLAYQFHSVVAGFRHLFKPFFKRQLLKYRPKHHGDFERHSGGFPFRRRDFVDRQGRQGRRAKAVPARVRPN